MPAWRPVTLGPLRRPARWTTLRNPFAAEPGSGASRGAGSAVPGEALPAIRPPGRAERHWMYIPGTNEFLSLLWQIIWPLLALLLGRRFVF
jgi:hypothetical protein